MNKKKKLSYKIQFGNINNKKRYCPKQKQIDVERKINIQIVDVVEETQNNRLEVLRKELADLLSQNDVSYSHFDNMSIMDRAVHQCFNKSWLSKMLKNNIKYWAK